jgi:hypothetical protein
VRLVLTDPEGRTLSALQTTASHVHKWAVGWMESEDVVVLQSSDVGDSAYAVSTNHVLFEVPITAQMHARANLLKTQKYSP